MKFIIAVAIALLLLAPTPYEFRKTKKPACQRAEEKRHLYYNRNEEERQC